MLKAHRSGNHSVESAVVLGDAVKYILKVFVIVLVLICTCE